MHAKKQFIQVNQLLQITHNKSIFFIYLYNLCLLGHTNFTRYNVSIPLRHLYIITLIHKKMHYLTFENYRALYYNIINY